MNALLAFPRAMLTMPRVWQGWMALMIVLNAVVPLVLIETIEGKAVLAAFVVAVALITAIHHAKGFVRLIGTWFVMSRFMLCTDLGGLSVRPLASRKRSMIPASRGE